MLDQSFANVMASYMASRFGIPAPQVVVGSGFGGPGQYFRGKIMLEPDANLHVLFHEFGHYVQDMGKYGNKGEFGANRFAYEEAKKFGIQLEPYRNYTLRVKANDPAKLFHNIVQNEPELGLSVKGYRIKGNRLDLLFTPMAPNISRGKYPGGQVASLAPIIWGILIIAGIAGIIIAQWQFQQAVPDYTKLLMYGGAITIVAVSLYMVAKLVD